MDKPRYQLDSDLSNGSVILLSKTPGLLFKIHYSSPLLSQSALSFTLRLVTCVGVYDTLLKGAFLVRVGVISGEFSRAMFRILARRRRAKIPMARTNKPVMPSELTKKGTIRYLQYRVRPSDHHMVTYHGDFDTTSD